MGGHPEQMEAAREEPRRYEELSQRRKPERQLQNIFGRGYTGRLAESRFRPEPTPRAYRGERVTGQAPCYAVMLHCVSSAHSQPVRSMPASRTCRAKGSIQPGRVVPIQRSWSPVHLLGTGYPAPALRTIPPVRLHSPVCPVPALHTHRAKVGIQDILRCGSSTYQASSTSPQRPETCSGSTYEASSDDPWPEASSDDPWPEASSDDRWHVA